YKNLMRHFTVTSSLHVGQETWVRLPPDPLVSATCWWRRAISTRRSRATGIALPLSSAWPPPIGATAVGSAISRCRTARSLRYLGNWDESQRGSRLSFGG